MTKEIIQLIVFGIVFIVLSYLSFKQGDKIGSKSAENKAVKKLKKEDKFDDWQW